MSKRTMNKLLKSVLKTAVCFLEQSNGITEDARDRVAEGLDRANARISTPRDHAQYLYQVGGHTGRNVVMFAAGVSLGIGAGILFAPASGAETRTSIGDKVQDFGNPARDRVSSEPHSATGTDGS